MRLAWRMGCPAHELAERMTEWEFVSHRALMRILPEPGERVFHAVKMCAVLLTGLARAWGATLHLEHRDLDPWLAAYEEMRLTPEHREDRELDRLAEVAINAFGFPAEEVAQWRKTLQNSRSSSSATPAT